MRFTPALALALFCADASGAQKHERFEASGVARLGERLLVVDDDDSGAYLSFSVELPSSASGTSGAVTLRREEAQRIELDGCAAASDLEGIAVLGERVLLLSEELHTLFADGGPRYRYAERFGPVGNRGLEGIAAREREDGEVEVAAVWEGGFYSPDRLVPDLAARLDGVAPLPVLVVHRLPARREPAEQKDDRAARTVELRLGSIDAPVNPGQRFRAKDLVWSRSGGRGDEVVVLLVSSARPGSESASRPHLWLQRFDLDGRAIGAPFDLDRWLRASDLENLCDENWEGLAWWEPDETLVLVHDSGGKGKTRALFVPLAIELRGTPVVDEATRIHADALVFDGHNDLPWVLRAEGRSSFDRLDISRPQPGLQTDIPKLRAGNVGAQFWSVWVPADSARTGNAAHLTLEQIELVRRMIERYPDTFELARSADDVERIHRAGRIASMLGIEGGYSIEESLPLLGLYYRLGVRYMTLTHADTIGWADSATDEPAHGGLTAFGQDVVREMNRLGMLVDISHVSVETMRDALRVSRAPIIASHSSAYAVAPHARNIPDDVLELLRANGGVVMVNFYSGFVVAEAARIMADMFDARRELRAIHQDDEEYERAVDAWRAAHPIPAGTVSDVVDHIDHIMRVAGIDHVGLGSDYDGVTVLPEGLEDASSYPAITRELVARGYSEADIRKVLGANALRVLRAAEAVARELAK